MLLKFHLLQPQKKVCIHLYVEESKKNHEIEICQEIGKRKGMHLWAKCFLQSSEIGRCPKKNLSNKSMCLITLRRY